MTERAPRRRASKRELRTWAWIAGSLAFFAPWAALGASPKPPDAAADERPVLIVRTITRRVVIQDRPTQAPVRYVYAPSDGSTSSAPGADTAPAPAPPPATSTGGS
ncbi:MAG TPA: hypothetical protein VID69_08380 [Actinomycetota bacterium]|jgi:hypothetical protein